MSRRRGEFEHRTSIFEGAFRAWSHLGGVEPTDLETKPAADLDPLNFPLANDPRLAAQKNKKQRKNDNNGEGEGGGGDDEFGGGSSGGDVAKKDDRREYPYEPLPRSGLAHPFVQAILSPWLGPDADQDAIQLGLTTLRTWWQHRRKGESGSAVVALGTDKMRGVVEGYTRHFFNLAHCLIVNDKEQPPRSLHTKMRDLEKGRNKKGKKRGREDESIKAAAMAYRAGFGPDPQQQQQQQQQGGGGNPMGRGGGGGQMAIGAAMNNNNVGNINMSPLEVLHAAQRRQLAESGGVQTNIGGGDGTGLPDPSAANTHPLENSINLKSKCMPGRVDLPKLVQQVSSSATQLAHRGSVLNNLPSRPNDVDPSKYGDPNVTPVVVVSPNGNSGAKDVQFSMTIDGITCAHCVKIIETVLKGCSGTRSPIDGLLDAAADLQLHVVLIRVGNIADVRRIAHESARNLSMVGYKAEAKSVTVPRDVKLDDVYWIFERTIPGVTPMMGFNWNFDCGCPDININRQGCTRHSQMGPGVIEAFDKTEQLLFNFLRGCRKKTGMPCTAGSHCFCSTNKGSDGVAAADGQRKQQQPSKPHGRADSMYQANVASQRSAEPYLSYQQPIQGGAPAGPSDDGNNNNSSRGAGGGGDMTFGRRKGLSLEGRMSIGGMGGLSRHLSLTSETTFGRSMSGLSALSIDWENMDDFDVNVDHSAGINNDIINSQKQQQQQQGRDDSKGGAQAAAWQQPQGDGQDGAGGGYSQQQQQQNQSGGGQWAPVRRSSFLKNNLNPNGNMLNVSFQEGDA